MTQLPLFDENSSPNYFIPFSIFLNEMIAQIFGHIWYKFGLIPSGINC